MSGEKTITIYERGSGCGGIGRRLTVSPDVWGCPGDGHRVELTTLGIPVLDMQGANSCQPEPTCYESSGLTDKSLDIGPGSCLKLPDTAATLAVHNSKRAGASTQKPSRIDFTHNASSRVKPWTVPGRLYLYVSHISRQPWRRVKGLCAAHMGPVARRGWLGCRLTVGRAIRICPAIIGVGRRHSRPTDSPHSRGRVAPPITACCTFPFVSHWRGATRFMNQGPAMRPAASKTHTSNRTLGGPQCQPRGLRLSFATSA